MSSKEKNLRKYITAVYPEWVISAQSAIQSRDIREYFIPLVPCKAIDNGIPRYKTSKINPESKALNTTRFVLTMVIASLMTGVPQKIALPMEVTTIFCMG